MPRLTIRYKNEKTQTGPYLVYLGTNPPRFYGSVESSNRKQGKHGLLELIKREIRKHGFYDPDLLDDLPKDDVS